MGDKSDSKKASSPYVVLGSRPLDHWKVTELKEELKKRKLLTKGLKDDLVKRLDEAVRAEMDEAKRNLEGDLNSEAQHEVQSDDVTVLPDVAEKTIDIMDDTKGKTEGLENDNMVEELDNENHGNRDVEMAMDMVQPHDCLQPLAEKMDTEVEGGALSAQVESFQVVQETHTEDTILVSEGTVSEKFGGQESEIVGNKNRDKLLDQQPGNGQSKLESQSSEGEQTKPGSSDLISDNQVDEVSQVQSDSIYTDKLSNTEKIELKDNVIADDVKLELDVKPDMVQPSLTNMDLDGSKSASVEVNDQRKDKALAEEKDGNGVESKDACKEDHNVIADDVKSELDTEKDGNSVESTDVYTENDNVIADDVKSELDADLVKSEMVQPSLTNMDLDGAKLELLEVNEEHKDKALAEEKGGNSVECKDVYKENDNVTADGVQSELDINPVKVVPLAASVIDNSESIEAVEPLLKVTAEVKYVNDDESGDMSKKNDSGDVGSSERLNLDRSSGDESMEEDALESKQIDSKFNCEEVGHQSEKIEVPFVKEDDSVHAMVEDATADKKLMPIEDKTGISVTSTKRKPHDQEAAQNSTVVKRQRRWNSEGLKVPEPQSTNLSASTTPKNASQIPFKRTFSRSESTISQESPKERVVPPSSKPPTTSLRINNFLRPFTLKAVQELLGKTGTVVSFWMDHIKTHCYVTYASVEEATETRNALCNLQWPVNGGRLLMADFVDPQEVKKRVDPPLPSPATTPVTNLPPATMQPPQPSPRLQVQKQQLPPPSLPPPPPLSNPLPPPPPPAAAAREGAVPPPPEKTDPPIVTLDDLFRKTRATPRIYYLPLSDEEVAAKLNALKQKQSAGVAFRKEGSSKGGVGVGGAGSLILDLGLLLLRFFV